MRTWQLTGTGLDHLQLVERPAPDPAEHEIVVLIRAASINVDMLNQALRISPSCVSAVTPSSRPISSAILPSLMRSTVVPVKCILRPVFAGNEPTKKSLNAGPVWVPPPSQRPTT